MLNLSTKIKARYAYKRYAYKKDMLLHSNQLFDFESLVLHEIGCADEAFT